MVAQRWVLESERVRRAATLGSEKMSRWSRETCEPELVKEGFCPVGQAGVSAPVRNEENVCLCDGWQCKQLHLRVQRTICVGGLPAKGADTEEGLEM